MRKTWIIAMAAAAVALAGCNRELEVTPAGGGLFRASIETPTRVAFSDEGAFSWQAGDSVAVSTNAGFKTLKLKDGANASVAAFEGDLKDVTSATVAVFPAFIAKDDKTVTLPAEYAWKEGQSFAAMYCDAVDLTKVNSFKHLGGILKISYADLLAGADALVLKTDAKITGDFEIQDGQIVAGAGTDQVTVTFKPGTKPSAIYIPVPTGEYNFSVELLKGGVVLEGTQKATSKAVKVTRKALVLMDAIPGKEPVKVTIATVEDFIAFMADVDLFPAGSEAVLTADLTLPETFVPDSLWCNFDGQGHKVTLNLDIPAEATYPVGLFSYVGKGLTVKNLKTAGSIKCAKQNVGGIAGKADENVTIENCDNAADILGVEKVTYHMGGILGDAASGATIRNCHNSGRVEMIIPNKGAANAAQIGGIAGHLEGTANIEGCVNDGQVTYEGTGTPRIGGICGYYENLTEGTFKDCINNAPVVLNEGKYTSSKWSYVGGLTGYYGTPTHNAHVLYEGCVNNGKVELNITDSKTKTRCGGIISHGGVSNDAYAEGELTWEVRNCTNNGEVVTTSTSANNFLGGVIGFTETTCKIICDGCTNNGPVTAPGSGSIGGILGRNCSVKSTFTNFTVGEKSNLTLSANTNYIGLVIGSAPSPMETAMTGSVKASTLTKKDATVEINADNYKEYLIGGTYVDGGTIEGINTEGVIFGDAPAEAAEPAASKTEILSGETVSFSIGASATDVKWSWKEGEKDVEHTGNNVDAVVEVAYPCENNDIQTIPVTVSATVAGEAKTWTIELKVKPYAIFDNAFDKSGDFQGFYGMAPVFSPDGKQVYVVTSQPNGSANAYSTETFEKLWSVKIDGRNQNACAVNPVTGDLYVPTSNTSKLYAITAAGAEKWTATLPDNVNQRGAPAVNKAGTTVFVTAAKHIVAVNTETGAIIWDKTLEANVNAVAVNGNEVIVGIGAAAKGILFLNAADGEEIASIDLPATTNGETAAVGIGAMTAFAVAADGKTAYVGGAGSNKTNNGMFYMIDIEAHSLLKSFWINETCTNGSNSSYEPVISPVNGDVFFGNKDSRVYCFDKDLNAIKWSYAHLESTNNAFNYSHPCVDADGNFMISAGQESPATYIFSPTGEVLKKYVYATDKDSTRSMAGNNYYNGILYTLGYGAKGHDGYFIAKYVGGSNPTGSWVRPGGDLCGSHCIK